MFVRDLQARPTSPCTVAMRRLLDRGFFYKEALLGSIPSLRTNLRAARRQCSRPISDRLEFDSRHADHGRFSVTVARVIVDHVEQGSTPSFSPNVKTC